MIVYRMTSSYNSTKTQISTRSFSFNKTSGKSTDKSTQMKCFPFILIPFKSVLLLQQKCKVGKVDLICSIQAFLFLPRFSRFFCIFLSAPPVSLSLSIRYKSVGLGCFKSGLALSEPFEANCSLESIYSFSQPPSLPSRERPSQNSQPNPRTAPTCPPSPPVLQPPLLVFGVSLLPPRLANTFLLPARRGVKRRGGRDSPVRKGL